MGYAVLPVSTTLTRSSTTTPPVHGWCCGGLRLRIPPICHPPTSAQRGLVLSGCADSGDNGTTSDGGDQSTQQDVTTPDSAGVTTDDQTTGADGDQGDADDTDDVDDAVSDSAGGSASASGTTQLDISERHPNGTLLDISSITIEERTFNIEAEFFNGGSQDVTIAIDGGTAIVMTDEAGNTYPFVTPEDESDGNLTIAPGESISGTWTFLGQVRDASSLTLTVNMWGGGQRAEPVGRNQLPGVQDRVPAVVKQSLSRALAAGAAATLLSSCVSSTQPASPTDPAPQDRPPSPP